MDYREEYMQMMTEMKALKQERLCHKQQGGVYDAHHILPKGATFFPRWKNRHSNIVLLTPDEHLQAHRLLVSIYGNSMAFALLRLLNDGRHVGTDAEKEAVRKAVSEKMSNVMREKWANEEYRETRIAQYKQGWQNSENKANINKGRSYSVRTPSVVNLDTNEIYDSVFRAEKATGICHIGDVVTGNRPIAGGYHWAYLDETLRVPYQDRLRKKAVVIDGVLFQRQKDAAEFLGITRAHLLAIIDGKKPSIHEIRRPTIEDQGKLTQKGE